MRRVKSAPADLATMAHRKRAPLPSALPAGVESLPEALPPAVESADPPRHVADVTWKIAQDEIVDFFDTVSAPIVPEPVRFPLSALLSHALSDQELKLDPCCLLRVVAHFFATMLVHQACHWAVARAEELHRAVLHIT